jgi:hypothetical protein
MRNGQTKPIIKASVVKSPAAVPSAKVNRMAAQ